MSRINHPLKCGLAVAWSPFAGALITSTPPRYGRAR